MQRKIFPFVRGSEGGEGVMGGFRLLWGPNWCKFSKCFQIFKGKIIFFPNMLRMCWNVEKWKKKKKLSTFWRGEGLKSQKVENSTFFIFFFDHFPKKQFMIKRIINIISIPVIVLYWPSFLYLSSYIIIVQIYQTKQIDDNIIPHRAHLGLGVLTLWCLFWLLSLKA